MKLTGRLFIGAFVIAMLGTSSQPVWAACPGAPGLSTNWPGNESYIYSAGQLARGWDQPSCYAYGCYARPVSADVEGFFWALGSGGMDNNGTFPVDSWLNVNAYPGSGYYYLPGAFLVTSWNASAGINGCLFDPVSGPDIPGHCTCVLLSDTDDTAGYFTVFSAANDAIGNTDLSRPGGASIVLKPVPQPVVIDTVLNPDTANLDEITVEVSSASTGIYEQDGCTCAEVAADNRKYRVYSWIAPAGSSPPSTLDPSAWQIMSLAGGLTMPWTSVDQGVALESQCGGADVEVYLAVQLQFDSGFTTSYLSSSPTPLLCGPCAGGETNDGQDETCAGRYGDGVVDEISSNCGFHSANPDEYSCEELQPGADPLYEYVRWTEKDFTGSCETGTTTDTVWVDPDVPANPNDVFYYLTRPLAPNLGSWGQSQAPGLVERNFTCGANPGLTFFTVEQDFQSAAGALTLEDFSCSSAEPGGACAAPSPLNSTTSDSCFSACLAPGFELNVPFGIYVTIGTGFNGSGGPAVGSNGFQDDPTWNFTPAVSAVGFKVFGDVINTVDVDCTYSGASGVLGVTTVHGTLQGAFAGAISTGDPITTVTCAEHVDGSADLYGALQFSAP